MKALRKNLHLYFLALLLVLNLWVWFSFDLGDNRSELLTVSFLDVGQGDATFIETPSGNQVLVDAGPNKEVLRALGSVMLAQDRSIDMIIATHPDKDHIGGFPAVLERFDVDYVVRSGVEADTGVYETFGALIDDEGS